jgi:hypothetical protein
LSKILGTPPNQTHVARFDIATCHHLICELTKFL